MQTILNRTVLQDPVIVRDLTVSAYTIPTDQPESDGTLQWNSTTLILVEIEAGDKFGLGYTYGDAAVAFYIHKTLKRLVIGGDAVHLTGLEEKLKAAIRNDGTCGLAMMALSAVDNALWDLKAKLLDMSLVSLLSRVREEVPVYGSGGFTSYSIEKLQQQLKGWAEEGLSAVKMKIGRRPQKDIQRVKAARNAIGEKTELYVDANGAYSTRDALEKGRQLADLNVSWFEEPVSSDNLEGLRFIKGHTPPPIRIAAGEYGYNLPYFARMLSTKAVDILQADATRCGGLSGFLKAGYLCEAHQVPFSFHCAPALHIHAACCLPAFSIGEYFYDHARIERMLFDGTIEPKDGCLKPDLSRPGLGLMFKQADAQKFKH